MLLPWETIFDVPKDCPAQVDIVLHQPHPGVTRPALLVVVADDVLIVGIGMFGQVSLNQVSGLLSSESEENVDSVDVTRKETNWVRHFGVDILEKIKIIT